MKFKVTRCLKGRAGDITQYDSEDIEAPTSNLAAEFWLGNNLDASCDEYLLKVEGHGETVMLNCGVELVPEYDIQTYEP